MALALEQPAQHLFGTTVVIDIGRVDEIHTLFARRRDDARRLVVRRVCSPNIMVPRHSGDTRRLLFPSLR